MSAETITRADVLQDAIAILLEHREDFEFEAKISPQTKLLADLGFESLEVVVLASATQRKYGRKFPFNDYFASLGNQESGDITVGQWVDFVYMQLTRPV